MPLVNLQAAPTNNTRRWFGISLACLLCLIAWFVSKISATWSLPLAVSLACLAGLVVIAYYAVPACQLPIIRIWQYVTFPIAWTVGHALLMLTYYLIFSPLGLLMKAVGYDPLELRAKDSTSAWKSRESSESDSRYFNQF